MGENHSDVAISLNNLALFYKSQGRYSEAEPLYLQALELSKRLLGKDHTQVAASLKNLSILYYSHGRYTEAKQQLIQALEIFQQRLGANHPDTVNCQEGLEMVRHLLNSTATDLPNFNQKAKKSGSKKKGKGFGKG